MGPWPDQARLMFLSMNICKMCLECKAGKHGPSIQSRNNLLEQFTANKMQLKVGSHENPHTDKWSQNTMTKLKQDIGNFSHSWLKKNFTNITL